MKKTNEAHAEIVELQKGWKEAHDMISNLEKELQYARAEIQSLKNGKSQIASEGYNMFDADNDR